MVAQANLQAGVSRGRTGVDALLDDAAPRVLVVRDLLRKVLVHEQVAERRVALVGLLDLVQEVGADDAAALQRQPLTVSQSSSLLT